MTLTCFLLLKLCKSSELNKEESAIEYSRPFLLAPSHSNPHEAATNSTSLAGMSATSSLDSCAFEASRLPNQPTPTDVSTTAADRDYSLKILQLPLPRLMLEDPDPHHQSSTNQDRLFQHQQIQTTDSPSPQIISKDRRRYLYANSKNNQLDRRDDNNNNNKEMREMSQSDSSRNEQWKVNVNSAISSTVGENPGLCAFLLTIVSVLLILATLPFSLFLCIKVVQEYERAVIFRLGRLVKGGAKGPGIFFIVPCIDSYCKVDLRTVSFDVPPQEILSRDSVTVAVDAVVYYRISNATIAVSNVEDYGRSTRLLAATTLRNVLGTKDLSQILSERELISHIMQSSLDEATDPWGVKVERVEIKDVRLPVQLQRAMAAEAEAAREARAKVIAAEGEQRASQALRQAAEVMSCNPAALQLRYLQTLSSIAGEKNSTIVFPIPMELFRCILKPDNPPQPQPQPQPPPTQPTTIELPSTSG